MYEPPEERAPSPLDRVYDELERWVRARLTQGREAPAADLPPRIDLLVRLTLPLRGVDRAKAYRSFERELEAQVARVRERLDMERLGYRAGHVYCHWCQSPICEHSLPNDARSVFVGFNPTGKPRWRDFASWIVDQRDPRVGRLFLEEPVPLAVFTGGPTLVQDLLDDFGRRGGPYRLVGQISAGFFPIPAPRGGLGSLALTGQLVERRRSGGEPSYSFNLIATLPPPHHLPTLVAERASPLLSDFVHNLRRSERELAATIGQARRAGRRLRVKEYRREGRRILEQVPPRFEKVLRRKQRRTQHAEERTLDPGRPTASALSDALHAELENFLYDGAEDTLIVRGPRRRVHVYNKDGYHITSIVYSSEAIRDRIRSGRWFPLEREDAADLKTRIRERSRLPEGDEDE